MYWYYLFEFCATNNICFSKIHSSNQISNNKKNAFMHNAIILFSFYHSNGFDLRIVQLICSIGTIETKFVFTLEFEYRIRKMS